MQPELVFVQPGLVDELLRRPVYSPVPSCDQCERIEHLLKGRHGAAGFFEDV